MTSGRKKKDSGAVPPDRRDRWSLVDLLLMGLYAAVAVIIVVGLALFMLWGALRD